MGFSTFATGPMTITYDGNSAGLTDGPIEWDLGIQAQDYFADLYGKTPIGGIYQGLTCKVRFRLKEWTSNTKAIFWPWGTLGQPGTHGRAMEDLAKSLVLTPVSGTDAADNGETYTFSKAILAAGHSILMQMGTTAERNIPIYMQCYLYDDTGTKKLFAAA